MKIGGLLGPQNLLDVILSESSLVKLQFRSVPIPSLKASEEF